MLLAPLVLLAACGQQQSNPAGAVSPAALTGPHFVSAQPGLPSGRLVTLTNTPSVVVTPCLPINYNSSPPPAGSGLTSTFISGFNSDTKVHLVISSGYVGDQNFGNFTLASGATTIKFSWNTDPYAVEYTYKVTGLTSGATAIAKQVSIDPANPAVGCNGAAPTVSSVQVPLTVIQGQSSVPLSAVVSDVQRGNSLIASAEYNVDGSSIWTPMSTVVPDALFNAVTETVQATVPLPNVVGPHVVCVRGTDAFGLTSAGTDCGTVTVTYPFHGFLAPVDNLPMVNTAQAGRAIPLKFSLSGNQGLNILAAGSPSVTSYDCASSVLTANTLATFSNSGLQYDAISDTYNYVWKSSSNMIGCYQVNVKLIDGTSHLANFQLR